MKPRSSSQKPSRVSTTITPKGSRRPVSRTSAFALAHEHYASVGVDVDRALRTLARFSISLQCWQGDDVGGFEFHRHSLGGGIAVTGNFPGKARSPEELRADLDQALKLIPGRHRVSLHACYGEFNGRPVDRDEISPDHFQNWIAWAANRKGGLDFNPTCFAHPKSDDGFTLSHRKPGIRQFWIEHCRRSREIGAVIGRALGTPCVTNLWIPDGFKDTPADRRSPRERLAKSLDAIFEKDLPAQFNLDSLESKLFGLGAESYTVGSHEFYLGYAITHQKFLCLDTGHFHPTESIADKLSALLPFVPGVLLHVSRGVRWDSDHVVILNDELVAVAREVVANNNRQPVHLGLDYFDASINRLAAWIIGTRALQRALLSALLEPPGIRAAELTEDYTSRLALQEEAKVLPLGAIWDRFCELSQVPTGERWLSEVKQYEKRVLVNRG